MDREIKFRAWNKTTKKMCYEVQNFYDTLGRFYDSSGKELDIYDADFSQASFGDLLVDEDIVTMQYTGLRDNTKWVDLIEEERARWTREGNMPSEWNGKKAYSGDIAKDKHEQIFEIKWDYSLLSHLENIWFKIIGNKYENSELSFLRTTKPFNDDKVRDDK